MRLQRYLTELFAGAEMIGSDIIEIFKNPDSKEMTELKKKSKYGFRVIVDIEKKSIYISSAEITHADMIKNIKPSISGLGYTKFSNTGEGMDKFLLFVTEEPNFNQIKSDSYSWLAGGGLFSTDDLMEIINKLQTAKSSKFNWLSKWVTPTQITKMLDNTIEKIQHRLDQRKK